VTRITQPLRTPIQLLNDAHLRANDDMVEQVYAVFESRGAGRTIRRPWIEYWLGKGKSPIEIVNIALGRPRRPDAHLGAGGIES
jgi:hypothetical protein